MQRDKTTDKLALSRALGAAFLSHQVEQLEKSVGKESRSTASNNWRERSGRIIGGRGGKPRSAIPCAEPRQDGGKKQPEECGKDSKYPGKPRERMESNRSRVMNKDADTIVVDASVLVHALGQLKKWCKDGRQEVILIPLEALNTLDMLKKGSTPLAQRARAASRILESQVGTNPRIRVQRDDAFVLWDEIPFRNSEDFHAPIDNNVVPGPNLSGFAPPPEWLRRTICCGRWEMVNALSGSTSNDLPISSALEALPPRPSTPTTSVDHSSYLSVHAVDKDHCGDRMQSESKVVLAVVTSSTPSGTGSSLDTSTVHPGRHERADGSLVRMWAQRAGIKVLDVEPSVMPTNPASHHGKSSPERRRLHTHGLERHGLHESKGSEVDREGVHKPSLVEKPIAITLVNEQPVKVLRVLARGEKLDP